ncbi:MAG: CvpA family protein [Hydrocarboniphaga sp.]|uniref:CvpA family protein n=1 Tax=Hydrocarboniphaga sp. TaxID=2033016 RepID=UPI002623D462|nr:CvpA family protein [Hydrocarboniphaga sp.]MDB5971857.1 CvpA family protein [Hydrocarboniphaga sp.]
MIWVDYCIVGLLVVSTIVGVIRGFARETLGLLTWILAIWLAVAFSAAAAVKLGPYISVPSVRIAAAYALLFLGGLLIGGIITALIVRFMRASALSSTDRTLGGGFGVIRGAVLVALFILIAGTTPARHDPWWQKSLLLDQFQWLADGLRVLIPPRWIDQLQSDTLSNELKAADESGESAPIIDEPVGSPN